MRICLVGELSNKLDEGMVNIASHFAERLSEHNEVITLNPKSILSRGFWRKAKNFSPQIIHYIPGPSLISLMIVKTMASYCKGARVVVSALIPFFPLLSQRFVPLFKPDLILTQSLETEKMFAKLGCKTKFLPSGVDTARFAPVSQATKKQLREKYGLDEGKFVILHVGSIKKKRNIQALLRLQDGANQVLIIGSESMSTEQKVYRELTEKGCLVWRTYFDHVEEIYALADCYVFPTISQTACIELPLSVMEAMSCNLPVISTRFGALPRIFDEGDGLFFVDSEEEIVQKLNEVKRKTIEIKTREKVLAYSWDGVVARLEEIYHDLIS